MARDTPPLRILLMEGLSNFLFTISSSFSSCSFSLHHCRLVVTGGVDQYIRVFDARDGQKDPATIEHCTDAINCLTVTVSLHSLSRTLSPNPSFLL